MPDYIITPEADHSADPTDLSNAQFAFGIADPGQVTGLANGTTYVARQLLLSPVSAAFTPVASAGVPDVYPAPTLVVTDQDIEVFFGPTPNDNGSPLTQRDLRYSTDQTSWTEVLNTTLPFTIAGLVPATTYFVQTRAQNAVGAAAWSPSASATTEAVASFNVTATGNNEIQIDNAAGTITVTVNTPATYAGTDIVTVADLASGPVNLTAPVVEDDGAPAPGETLSHTPGLWVYNVASLAPVVSYQWLRDGAPIVGATAADYTLVAADAGTTVAMRETQTQSGTGTRSATSAGVSVAAAPTGPTVAVTDAAASLASGAVQSFTGLSVGPASAGRKVLFAVTIKGNRTINDVSVAGVGSATEILAEDGNPGIGLYEIDLPTGTTCDVTVTASGSVSGTGLAAIAYTNGTLGTPVQVANGTADPADLSLTTTAGATVLALVAGEGSDLAGWSFSGIPEAFDILSRDNGGSFDNWFAGGLASGVAAESPRAMSVSGQGTLSKASTIVVEIT